MQSRRVQTFATIVAAVYRGPNALALAVLADSTVRGRAPHRPLTEKADFRETIVVGWFVRALALCGRSRAQGPGHMGGDAPAGRPPSRERAAALRIVAMQRSA